MFCILPNAFKSSVEVNSNSLNARIQDLISFVKDRLGHAWRYALDSSSIKALGWEPKVSFEEGVGHMLKDIEQWNDAPLWDKESIADATKGWFKYLGKEK